MDCHARLDREAIRSGRTDSAEEDLVATRLLQILITSLWVTLTSSHDGQPKDQLEEAGAMRPPRSWRSWTSCSLCPQARADPKIARAAALGLQTLLSLETHELSGLMTTHICRSTAMQHCATWLLGDEGVAPASVPTTHPVALKLAKPTSVKLHPCDHIYLELLVSAATVARPDESQRRGARSPVFDDTVAMLQVCTRGSRALTRASRTQLCACSALCLSSMTLHPAH